MKFQTTGLAHGSLLLTLIYPAHFEDVPCQSGVNHIFVSPELSSVRDYVITHSVRSLYVCSMCMYVVMCKIDHCIHIH